MRFTSLPRPFAFRICYFDPHAHPATGRGDVGGAARTYSKRDSETATIKTARTEKHA